MPYEKHGKIVPFPAFCYWKCIKKAIPPKQTKNNNNNKRPRQNPRKKYKRHQLSSLSELSIFLSYARLQRDRKEGRRGRGRRHNWWRDRERAQGQGRAFQCWDPGCDESFPCWLKDRSLIKQNKTKQPPKQKPWWETMAISPILNAREIQQRFPLLWKLHFSSITLKIRFYVAFQSTTVCIFKYWI